MTTSRRLFNPRRSRQMRAPGLGTTSRFMGESVRMGGCSRRPCFPPEDPTWRSELLRLFPRGSFPRRYAMESRRLLAPIW
jgi:hypothetical protein